tara:strand:- start:60 stop:407 length:348 start_codon:yes stop_codon:yes gene_type:complete
MATFDEAVKAWTRTINDWYDICASTEEVAAAYRKGGYDQLTDEDETYEQIFFRDADGEWTVYLDTVDRENLADAVEIARGHGELPTYAELGHGGLMNKAPRPCCGDCKSKLSRNA